MRFLKKLRALRLFRRNEDGTLSVETAMMFPLLIFSFAGTYTFFDAFRVQNVNVRASYTVADLLSRETNMIDEKYLAGVNKILRLLTRSDYETILRVTVVTYNKYEQKYKLKWSKVDGGTGDIIKEHTPASLEQITDKIPIMDHGDINIMVETWSGFVPVFDFGIDPYYFEHTVVTRPRFAPQLCWKTC